MRYLILLICVFAFADTTINIKDVWDFRDNKWKTAEFVIDKKGVNKVKIYTTAEDVTSIYQAEFILGEVKHYLIKEKKE